MVALLALPMAPALAQPTRIVSMNVCTDQLTLMLAPRKHIKSLSYLVARPDISVSTEAAAGLVLNHGQSEEILPLDPDLVFAGRYTARPIVFLLQDLGYNLVELDISRSLGDIRERVRQVGRAVGAPEQAQDIVAAMDARLAQLAPRPGARRPSAAYYQRNGYTAGRDTLVGDVIAHAGLENLGARFGIHGNGRLPLETLLQASPEILIIDDHKPQAPALAYEILQHPALMALMQRAVPVVVPTRLWICGLPSTLDAVEILAQARQRVLEGGMP